MLNLAWVKSWDGKWINLNRIDLTHVNTTGVYIIWHGGNNPRIVRVGHGNIAQRLSSHRRNHQIMRFSSDGPLMVTWAALDHPQKREGVQNYLSQQFKPLIKERTPDTPPMIARSPFA